MSVEGLKRFPIVPDEGICRGSASHIYGEGVKAETIPLKKQQRKNDWRRKSEAKEVPATKRVIYIYTKAQQ